MENECLLPKNVVCGYFDCSEFANMTLSPIRRRARFEIEYYLIDGRRVFSGGNEYPIRKNHILLGKPGELCNSELPFETKFLKFEVDGMLAERLMQAPAYFCVLHATEIETLLDELIALRASDKLDAIAFYGKLLLLLSMILEDSRLGTEARSPADASIASAKSFIEKNLAMPLRLADIAASVSLSPSYFHALFSAKCGMTPHDYLLDCRIRAAKHLLAVTSLSIGEIAEECGFGTQQYMNYIFREKVGQSPGRCRRAFRQDYLK